MNGRTGMTRVNMLARGIFVAVLVIMMSIGTSVSVRADEEDAKRILKAMSDFMGTQDSLAFEYDAILEVVTVEGQILALASSGAATIERPDKFHVTRSGGFADLEMFFDGQVVTLLGNNLNMYAQIELPGTLDHLMQELHRSYNMPLPAADLLLSNAYDELMQDVVDIKDLGSGVIGGIECDHLAFRTDEVDWQIWIAHGERPYPYRFSIHSKLIEGGPQYIVQTGNWKVGDEVAVTDFSFTNPTNAEQVELEKLAEETGDLPSNYSQGDSK